MLNCDEKWTIRSGVLLNVIIISESLVSPTRLPLFSHLPRTIRARNPQKSLFALKCGWGVHERAVLRALRRVGLTVVLIHPSV